MCLTLTLASPHFVPSSISKIGTLGLLRLGPTADAPTRALTASWVTYDLTSLSWFGRCFRLFVNEERQEVFHVTDTDTDSAVGSLVGSK